MFEEGILFLADLGVADIILPFILIFVVLFAVLEKTQSLQTRQLRSVVAFSVALLMIGFDYYVGIFNRLLSLIGLVLIAYVLFMILTGFFTIELKKAWVFSIASIVMGIILIIVFELSFLEWLGNALSATIWPALLTLVIFFGLIYWITSGEVIERQESSKSNSPKSPSQSKQASILEDDGIGAPMEIPGTTFQERKKL